MPNPYFFTHAVPSLDMFVGRRQELDEIVKGILTPRFAKSYAVIGGHRMGKTSLLLAVRQTLIETFPDDKSCVVGPVFLSTQEIPHLSQASICRRVVERLREEVCPLRGWTISSEELDRADLSDEQAIPALQRVLRSAIKGISPGFRLVILLDEVDRLVGMEWSDTFFSLLRNLVSVGELAPHVSVVVAGTVAIHQLYRLKGSPFFNVLAAIKTLRLLSDDESRTLIERPNESTLPPEIVDAVIGLTGGHPFLIQYLMSGLWDLYAGELQMAKASDLDGIVQQYLENRRDFQYLADDFTPQDILAFDEISNRNAGPRTGKQAVRNRLGSIKAANDSLDMLVHCGAIRQYSALEFGPGGAMFRDWFYDNITVPAAPPPEKAAPARPAAPAPSMRQVIRIFLASPGDVVAERKLAKEAVDALNGNIADENGFVLQLVSWENNSRPGLDQEGAQQWLNRVLQIEKIDLLVGIFWRRFGTRTERADSGTEEEIRTAVKAWNENGHSKPQVMLYFSQKPGPPPATAAESMQLTKVLTFKEECQKLGLLWSYEDEAQFGRIIRDHLTQHILQMARQNRAERAAGSEGSES